MKLYYSPGACSMASHIALEELGIKHDLVPVKLHPKDPDYVKINPKGYVPALKLDDGDMLTENAVILQYLADQKPEAGLFPKPGTKERYHGMEMLNYVATEMHKGFGMLWATDALVPKETSETFRNNVIGGLKKKFDFLTTKLEGRKFLLGDQFSICDAYLFTILNWTHILKVDMKPWPALMGYMERVAARPAVQAAMKAEHLK